MACWREPHFYCRKTGDLALLSLAAVSLHLCCWPVFLVLGCLKYGRNRATITSFFCHSFKKTCFPAESMLDKFNFSHSDKRNFPNSDVRTDNCLILLLQHVFPAAGRPAFFLWASWQKCKQFKAPWYQLLFVTIGAWMLVCFPKECINWSSGPCSFPCVPDRGEGSRLGRATAKATTPLSELSPSCPAPLCPCYAGKWILFLGCIPTGALFSGAPLLRSFSRTQTAFLYLVLWNMHLHKNKAWHCS